MGTGNGGLNSVDASLRVIALQFLFTNPDIIPTSIRTVSPDTAADLDKKNNTPSGVLFIESTENVDPAAFLEDLITAGYQLVDAFYQPRPDVRRPSATKHMVRFIFTRAEHAKPTQGFLDVQLLVQGAVKKMCADAMWSVCAYRNPLVVAGQRVDGESALSINFVAPRAYNEPDGTPTMVWPKDTLGKKTKGGDKIPLASDFTLRIHEAGISMTASQPQVVH